MEVHDGANDVIFEIDDVTKTFADVTIEWADDVIELSSDPVEDGIFTLYLAFGKLGFQIRKIFVRLKFLNFFLIWNNSDKRLSLNNI